MRLILCFGLTILSFNAAAQAGCPDPQASNYNASATSNDGSCLYPVTYYTPVLKADFPNELREISGFTKADGKWWGHNDSNFDEEFFRADPETGEIFQKIKLDNGKNRDWEDIAADAQNLYIADVGNNNNDRQNLGIYIVPISAIGNSNSETIGEFVWNYLPFSYIDQTDFTEISEDSSVYDCEAMIVVEGKIHLFTKSRRNNNTVHYAVNTSNNVADKLETFNTEGLITGASIAPNGKVIALIGYDLRPFIPTVFCWLLWDWPTGTDQYFSGNKRRIELGSALQVGQVESIGFNTNRTGYLTNERTAYNGVTIVDESVRSFDFSPWLPTLVSAPEAMAPSIQISPNPFTQVLHFKWPTQEKPDFLRIKNQLGQNILTLYDIPETLDLGHLRAGFYLFEIWKDGAVVGVAKGIKQ